MGHEHRPHARVLYPNPNPPVSEYSKDSALGWHHLRRLVRVTRLVLPAVALTICRAFRCTNFAPGHTYLLVDLR